MRIEPTNNFTQQYLDAAKAYYDGEPIMSDAEFDALERLVPEDVVLRQVEGELSDELIDERLSIKPLAEHSPIIDFFTEHLGKEILFSLKIDGINTKVLREYSSFKALSRARDDREPIDYSIAMRNVLKKQFDCIEPGTLLVGESFVPKELLQELRLKYPNIGFKKTTSGATSLLRKPDNYDQSDFDKLMFLVFYKSGVYKTKLEMYESIEELGLSTPPHKLHVFTDKEKIQEQYTEIMEELSRDYPADGVVAEINDLSFEEEIKGKYSNREIALKVNEYRHKTHQGVVTKLIATPGKSAFGLCACIEPLDINGSTYTRVNIYNIQYVLDYEITVGSVIDITVQSNSMAVLATK